MTNEHFIAYQVANDRRAHLVKEAAAGPEYDVKEFAELAVKYMNAMDAQDGDPIPDPCPLCALVYEDRGVPF